MISIPNEALFFGGYALDIFGVYVLSRINMTALRTAAFVNMLLISLFAQKAITVFGITSNIGNIFYAAVIFTMTLLALQYGKKETLKSMHIIFGSMILFLVLSQFVIFFPAIVGEEEPGELTSIAQTNVQFVVAAFLAFYTSSGLNAYLMGSKKFVWYKKIISNISAQAVDSVVFFPIAFYNLMPFRQMVYFMIGGFILKSILNVIDTPLVKLFNEDAEPILERSDAK